MNTEFNRKANMYDINLNIFKDGSLKELNEIIEQLKIIEKISNDIMSLKKIIDNDKFIFNETPKNTQKLKKEYRSQNKLKLNNKNRNN